MMRFFFIANRFLNSNKALVGTLYFILSPSTLHYWGAYLSRNDSKICLAPKNIKNKSGYYGFSNNRDIKPTWWKDI